MRIIISESQYKFLISESKFDKLRPEIINNIEKYGIGYTAQSMGITPNKLIDMFNITFNDDKAKELIKHYIDNFDYFYELKKLKNYYCTNFIDESFLDRVQETILEYLYYNYYENKYNASTIEFDNVANLASNYVDKKYGKLIKDKFIENCKK
jgi:hypothetical protein